MRSELKPEKERVVVQTRVWGSGGEWVISTAALTQIGVRGENYETKAFTAIAWDHGPRIEDYKERYPSEEAAREGHERIVGELEAVRLPWRRRRR
jgi:hypothetical protein